MTWIASDVLAVSSGTDPFKRFGNVLVILVRSAVMRKPEMDRLIARAWQQYRGWGENPQYGLDRLVFAVADSLDEVAKAVISAEANSTGLKVIPLSFGKNFATP